MFGVLELNYIACLNVNLLLYQNVVQQQSRRYISFRSEDSEDSSCFEGPSTSKGHQQSQEIKGKNIQIMTCYLARSVESSYQ